MGADVRHPSCELSVVRFDRFISGTEHPYFINISISMKRDVETKFRGFGQDFAIGILSDNHNISGYIGQFSRSCTVSCQTGVQYPIKGLNNTQ